MQSQLTFHFIRKTMNSNQHSSQSEPLQIEVGPFHSFALSPSPHFRNQGPWKDLVQSRQPPSSTLPGPLHWPTLLMSYWLTGFTCHLFSDECNPPWVLPAAAAPFLLYLSTKHFTFRHYTRLAFVCPISVNYPPNWFLFTDSNPASSTKELKYLLNWWMDCSTDMQSLLKWKARSPDNLRS